MKKIILYTFFSTTMIVLGTYDIFVNTDLFVPQQKEVKNSEQLVVEVFNELGELEKLRDTVFFSFYGIPRGICGNDFQEIPSPYKKKMLQIKSNKEHPYIIDEEKLFRQFNNNTIESKYNKVIIGSITKSYLNDTINYVFKYRKNNFNAANFERVGLIYGFDFDSINKNEVAINLYNYSFYNGATQKYKVVKLKFIFEKGKWGRKNL